MKILCKGLSESCLNHVLDIYMCIMLNYPRIALCVNWKNKFMPEDFVLPNLHFNCHQCFLACKS